VARAAKWALGKVVHHAGRPDAAAEARQVEAALLSQLRHESATVRRELLWLLSEIGGADSVPAIAALLRDAEVREDARMVLQRLPDPKAVQALREALREASADFRPALADALRQRGEKVEAYPTQKLTPTRATEVKPVP
jgi:HEAT repeat protein